MKIAVGSDHGGIHLKNHIREYLTAKGIEVLDCGTYTEESTDYPDYAAKVCQAINTGECAGYGGARYWRGTGRNDNRYLAAG